MKTRPLPAFEVYKKGVTINGKISIMAKALPGEAFDKDAKRKFYESLGYTVTENIDGLIYADDGNAYAN